MFTNDIYDVLSGRNKISETDLNNHDTMLAIVDPKTCRYMDSNIAFLEAHKREPNEMYRMTAYDTAIQEKKVIRGIDDYYKEVRRYGRVGSFIKDSRDKQGRPIRYNVETRYINSSSPLLVCTVKLLPPRCFEKRSNNVIFLPLFKKVVGG